MNKRILKLKFLLLAICIAGCGDPNQMIGPMPEPTISPGRNTHTPMDMYNRNPYSVTDPYSVWNPYQQ